ncbi:MAG: peptidylprolyl isomerase [Marinovum sp.]|nr:peptidylprolyl isomerase [Marinovum sp.]
MFKLIPTVLVALCMATTAVAQNLFAPAIKVNDDNITNYELQQRATMLGLLRAPGNPDDLAREQLIDDRLRIQAASRAGTLPTEAEIIDGMSEFAARANLTREEFVKALAGGGVDESTFREFVRAGIAWRTLIQQRFAPRSQVSEQEIDRALARRANGGSGVRVLLSEIIIPAPPEQAEAAQRRAQDISNMTTEAEFSRAARRFSATATRGAGGRLPWQNLNDLPPVLRPLVLGLAPGEVTDPINIPNAVALFQLRAIEELPYVEPTYSSIEYAAYYMPGGRSDASLAKAKSLAAHVDQCDDLYGVAQGQPEDVLDRGSLPPDQLPTDIAIELAKLDPGEVSTALTRASGETLVFLMLCGRSIAIEAPEVSAPAQTAEADEDGEEIPAVDPEVERRRSLAIGLQNRRVESLAGNFLAQLRADARIVEQ